MSNTDLSRNVWPGHMRADTAAQYLDVAPRTLSRMVAAGIVKPHKLGPRTLRYSRDELDRAIALMPHARGERPGK